jgi:hypothetical protein
LPDYVDTVGQEAYPAGFTARVFELDVPPPGAGLVTVTASEPGVATSAGWSATVIEVGDQELGGRVFAPICMVDEPMKPLPVMLIDWPTAPTDTLVG